MRVSNRSTARSYLKYLNKARSDFAKTNEQVFSGNRFSKLSDDVSSGTRVLRNRVDMYKAQKHLDNVKSVNDELSAAEDSMTFISELLSDVHKLSVKAMSNEKGSAGHDAIANEIESLKDELLQFANAQHGKKYLFGGSNASPSAPFQVGDDGRLTYNGISVDSIQQDADGFFYNDVDGNRQEIPMDEDVYMDIGLGIKMTGSQIDGDTGVLVSFSGLEVLGFGKNADGLSGSIYNIIADIENSIKNYDSVKIGKFDTQLTQMTDKFGASLTSIGSKTRFLDSMQNRLTSVVDGQKERIQGLMGANDAETATQLKMNESVLQAVLQMGSRILPVSLMDFLR